MARIIRSSDDQVTFESNVTVTLGLSVTGTFIVGTVSATNVNTTNLTVTGTIDFTTPLPIAEGGTGAPDASTARTNLDVPGLNITNTFSANQEIQLDDDGAGEGPVLILDRNSASPALNDILGSIRFQGRNSVAAEVEYGNVTTVIVDSSNGTETADLDFSSRRSGTLSSRFLIGEGFRSTGATGGDQGPGTINIGAGYYINGIILTGIGNEWTVQQNFDAATKNGLGAELVTNGTFATSSDWTTGTGWSISAGVASVDGTQGADSDLEQDIVVTNGNSYQVTFEITSYTAGTITPVVGGTSGTARSAVGTFTETIVAGAGGSPRLELRADSTGNMSIDNVSVNLLNVSWDLDAEQVLILTLDGTGHILDNPTNQNAGGTYILIVNQDATGGRTLSFGSNYLFPAGTVPTLSTDANAVDVLSFVSNGTSLLGVSQLDFQ